jgi:hypothetical protein
MMIKIITKDDDDELGSSVNIVSGNELDDRTIEVRSPGKARGYFLYPLWPDRLWAPPSRL